MTEVSEKTDFIYTVFELWKSKLMHYKLNYISSLTSGFDSFKTRMAQNSNSGDGLAAYFSLNCPFHATYFYLMLAINFDLQHVPIKYLLPIYLVPDFE